MDASKIDCLVVGGGPAGLTAAIYLARFHLDVVVIDARESRAATIPMSHNHAGYPEGISGRALLDQMQIQALRFGAKLQQGRVEQLSLIAGGFRARSGSTTLEARSVLLATGIVNRRPSMDGSLHDLALATGRLRYCPICDGYEATDQRIAVIGKGERGVAEAIYLRGFTKDVSLIDPDGPHRLNDEDRTRCVGAGIVLIDGPTSSFGLRESGIEISMPAQSLVFDTLYPALGSEIRSELGRNLGALASEEGCLLVDRHQRTNVPGLYAAGDVVLGLDQISHAMGEGGVAATTMRNDLAKLRPLLRP